jgi:hypothetical protein
MSGERRDEDFSTIEDARVRRVRRDGGQDDQGVTTIGYVPGSQRAQPFPGDDKFPFVKDVTDIEGPKFCRDGAVALDPGNPPTIVNPLPQVTDPFLPAGTPGAYEISPEFDVRPYRQLMFVFSYFPGPSAPGPDPVLAAGLLSIVPEVQVMPFTPQQAPNLSPWQPIGVVNPVLELPAVVPGFGYRRVYSTELRFDGAFTGPPPAVPQPVPYGIGRPLTLAFDVSAYRDLRIKYGDLITDSSTLAARVFLQR